MLPRLLHTRHGDGDFYIVAARRGEFWDYAVPRTFPHPEALERLSMKGYDRVEVACMGTTGGTLYEDYWIYELIESGVTHND